jgi:uncharacterized membrane protein YuzA (DUF378 family)
MKKMPASSIAQILLRLFALNWFLMGIIQIASVVFMSGEGSYFFWSIAPSFVYVVAGVIFWFVAPPLSRLLAKRNDGEFTLAGVTERHLYSTAFLALGLYFALDSFANVFNWIHFFAINKSPDYGFHHEEAPSYYELTEGALTLVAGVALMLSARTWAAKLTRNTNSEQDGADQPATAPELEPGGDSKPQPESEGRSQ